MFDGRVNIKVNLLSATCAIPIRCPGGSINVGRGGVGGTIKGKHTR